MIDMVFGPECCSARTVRDTHWAEVIDNGLTESEVFGLERWLCRQCDTPYVDCWQHERNESRIDAAKVASRPQPRSIMRFQPVTGLQ